MRSSDHSQHGSERQRVASRTRTCWSGSRGKKMTSVAHCGCLGSGRSWCACQEVTICKAKESFTISPPFRDQRVRKCTSRHCAASNVDRVERLMICHSLRYTKSPKSVSFRQERSMNWIAEAVSLAAYAKFYAKSASHLFHP